MLSLVRPLAGAAIVAALLLLPSRVAPAATMPAATSFAGQWQYSAMVHCANPKGIAALVCTYKLGYQTTGSAWSSIKSDAKGNFTFTAAYVVTEDMPKAKSLCSPKVFATKYNGACYITSTGTGKIGPGFEGKADFLISDEMVTYHVFPKNLIVHDPMGKSSYPLDTGVPAVPGVYDAKALLVRAGLMKPTDKPPAGLYIKMQVDHHA